jgi:hypothetical protein
MLFDQDGGWGRKECAGQNLKSEKLEVSGQILAPGFSPILPPSSPVPLKEPEPVRRMTINFFPS